MNPTCVACEKELEEVMPGVGLQPHHGVVSHVYGNYGSGVWDPIDSPEYLLFVLCDECLTKAGQKGYVLRGRKVRAPEDDLQLWRPEEHAGLVQ